MRTTLLLAALCFPVLTMAQAETQNPYSISPYSVQAGVSFDLSLRSFRFNCGTQYSHQSIAIDTALDRITLSFLPAHNPNATCPAVVVPYGPTFALNALPAGAYSVYARALSSCMVGEGAQCAMEPVPEFAGTLTVGRGASWILTPSQVPPEHAFTLRLLSQSYGNCNTSFSGESLDLVNGALYASFDVIQHPERVCIADIRPHGPSFETKGFSVGDYPVYAVARLDATAKPPTPQLVDTLQVFKGADPTGIRSGNGSSRSPVILPESPLPGTIRGYRADGRVPEPAGTPAR